MKNKVSKIVWGIIAIALGVVFIINATGVADVDLFFKGWWTLFIIIPCLVGLVFERDKIGNLIGLSVGVLLLLCVRDIIEFSMLFKLIIPIIIIAFGIKLVWDGIFGNKSAKMAKKLKEKLDKESVRSANGIFSGADVKCVGEEFKGAELNAIFGGVDCDIREAIIEGDCYIEASAIFGGIDIKVPDGINVKINSTSVFGGVSDKKERTKEKYEHTLYVNATCIFGGVDIK